MKIFDSIRLLSILFALSANAAIETAPNWSESEPPIRFKSRDWADAVLAAASTNSLIAIEGGRLLSNATWSSERTHLVFNTVYVPSGITLTISAGTVVKFCPGTMIKVEDGGKLNIVGASGNDVILTAANDATVGEVIVGLSEESFAFDGIRLQSSGATFTDNSHLETRGFNYGSFPTVSVLGTEAVRNGGVAYIPFTLSGSLRETAFSIEWEAIEGTAKFGDDYTLASGTISWGKSSEGTKTLQIPINAANVTGEERTFTVRIKAARCSNIGTRTATVKIVERDALTLEWAPNWAESEPPIRFKSRNWADAVLAAASTNSSIAIEGGRLLTNTTWDATKTHLVFNTVYVPSGITLTISTGAVVKFCPGTTIKVEDGGKLSIVGASGNDVILTAANDATVGEAIEGFTPEQSIAFDGIRLQSTAATFTDNGWLETRGFNYAAYPSVTLNDSTAFRSSGLASIPVTISGSRDQTLTIDWVAVDDTAKYGEDYTLASGRITWGKASEGTKTISIPLVTTNIVGATTSFKIKIVTARGANIADGECTVSIREFDTLNIESGSAESTPPIRFKSRDWADAVLAAASTNSSIAIEGGRLLSNATWSSERTHLVFNTVYVPSGITLTISAGAVVKFCPGTMIKVEDGGKLSIVGASGNDVILTAANDATVGEVVAGLAPEQSIAFDGIRLQSTAATFTDNGWLETRGFSYGAYPSVTLHDATANRKAGMVYLPVTVGGTTRNQSFTVDWVAEDESAQFGRDYKTYNSGRLTWSKSGDGTKYITIPLVTTEKAGTNRTFTVRFVVARGVNVTDGEATVTIAEFAFDGLNGQPVEITTNAVSSTEFAIKESIGSQPIFLNDVEQIRYSGKWQTYDKNDAAALRVTVDSDNGTEVLKECAAAETGAFELRQADYATGFYTLKHEILNNLGETLATMKKSFSIIDTEDVELHGGILTRREVWSADKVHVVYETVTVPAAYTLFIEPGAIVKFMTGTGIDISQGGALFANKIVFTHINDDTIGGDTLSDGYTVAPPMDAYTLSGNFTFGDDTELRNITQNTALTGTISTRKVLSRGSTYRVSGTLTIANGGSLTIPPGTVLKMESGASIVVNSGATLTAVGTRAAPIIITSIKDDSVSGDTNGDGNKTIPQPGDWVKIGINGGTANFEFTSILYSSKNQTTGAINMNGGTVVFNNSEIAHGMYDAVGVESGHFYMTNSVIRDCLLAFRHWAKDPIVNSVIYDCGRLTQGGGQHFVNCIFSRITETWEAFGFPQNGTTYDNCSFWNEGGSILTAEGKQDAMTVCGKNGNIWGDPLFVDPDNGDFRIQELSPCVDAADSSIAPEFDYYGQPRITVTEQGTNTVGQLADIGICEVMPRNVTSDIDLVPQNVRTVTNAVPGELLFVKWEVKNAGGKELEGAWRDTVSLVSNNGREVQLGVKTTSGVIAPGGSIFCSGYFTIPPISEGEWYPKVNVNSYRDVFEGALGINNALVGDRALTVKAEALDPSVVREGVIGGGTPSVVKLTFGADDENRMVKFDVPAGVKVTWGFGFMPQGASQSGSMTATDGGVMFRVPEGATDVYVVLESDKTATYEMTTESTKMVITEVTPNTLPASGTTTLTITGAGFGETNAVLLSTATDSIRVQSTAIDNGGNLIATVDCSSLKAGKTYALTVESGELSATVDGAVAVTRAEGKGVLEAKLVLPETARQGRIGVGYIEYANVGTADMNLPIFIVSSATGDTLVSMFNKPQLLGNSIKLVGISEIAPYRVLKCGEKGRLPFCYMVKDKFELKLSVVDETSLLVRDSVFPSWSSFCGAISAAAERLNNNLNKTYAYDMIYENAMRYAYGQDAEACVIDVINAITEEPAAGIQLKVFDSESRIVGEYVSDDDGRVFVSGLAPDEIYGLLGRNCTIDMSAFKCAGGCLTQVTVRALPYAKVNVSAAGKDGVIPNEDVEITLSDEVVNYSVEDDGCVMLPDGTYRFNVLTDLYLCYTNASTVTVSNGVADAKEFLVPMIEAGKATFEFYDVETGESLTNVYACLQRNGYARRLSRTADSHHYCSTIPPGNFELSVSSDFELSEPFRINIDVNDDANFKVPLKRVPFTAFPPVGAVPFKTLLIPNEKWVNGKDLRYFWDFDGDGVTDSTNRIGVALYSEAKTYNVSLKIIDAEGEETSFARENAVEVWEEEIVQPSGDAWVLDENSHLKVLTFDGTTMVLEATGTGVPYYLKEGMKVILPDDALRPYEIQKIEFPGESRLVLSLVAVSPYSAYSRLRVSSVLPLESNLSDEDYISKMKDIGLPLPHISIGFTPEGGWRWNRENSGQDDNIDAKIEASGLNFDFHYDQDGLNLGLCVDWDETAKLHEKVRGMFLGIYGRYHGTLTASYKPKAAFNGSKKYFDTKKSYEFPIVGKTIPIGAIPGTFSVKGAVDISAGFTGSVSYEPQVDIYVGALWRSGKWSFIDTYSSVSSPDAFNFTIGGGISAFIGPKISLGIGVMEGSVGVKLADANLKAGVAFNANAEKSLSDFHPDTYSAKLAAKASLSIDLLKAEAGDWFSYAAYSFTPPSAEYVFWEWKLETPLPQMKATVSNMDIGSAEVEFLCAIQGETSEKWSFNDSKLDYGDGSYADVRITEDETKTFFHTYRVCGDDTVIFDAIWRQSFKHGWLSPEKASRVRVKVTGKEGEEPCVELEEHNGSVPQSNDPNEMSGPLGLGDPNTERFVKPGEWMTYTVYFENMTNATAAAQEVYVTNPLSEWLDWSTFEMGEVSFGNQIDLGLSGKSSGTTEKRMDGTNWIVRTELSIEPDATALASNRQQKMCAKWYLRIVDPSTNTGWPVDPVAGFLPPNNPDTHCGEGHLTYRIKLRDDAPGNVVITNSATIVFDYNEPITTDPAWWNTVAPTEGMAKFSEADILAEEGTNVTFSVFGGNAYNTSSVKLYLTYNTAAAADVDLKASAVVDSKRQQSTASDSGIITNLKFPLALTWAAGEIGEKTITIPIKADKAIEDAEQFTLQLGDPVGMELGEARLCTVTITDPGYAELEAKIAAGTATKAEKTAWDKLQKAKAPYIRGVADPANAGKVTGSGRCAAGKKVTLKATANKGYVFTGWLKEQIALDGDRLVTNAVEYIATTPSLVIDRTAKPAKDTATSTTLTNVNDNATFYAAFITTDEDKAAVGLTLNGGEVPQSVGNAPSLATNIMCGVAVNWPLASSALSQTTVKVAGLPAGLKFTAKDIMKKGSKTEVEIPANTIYGAPTAASKTDKKTGLPVPSAVKVTVTTAGKSSVTYLMNITVDALPDWAVGNFEGFVSLNENNGGLATMSVTAAGKVSGKIAYGGTNWTFKADSFAVASETVGYTNLAIRTVATSGKATLDLSLNMVDFLVDSLPSSTTSFAEGYFGEVYTMMYRLPWMDKGDTSAASLIASYAGAYSCSVPYGDDSGDVTFVLDEKGVVKGVVILPDGAKTRKATFSSNALTGDNSLSVVIALPPDAKKGYPAVFKVVNLINHSGEGADDLAFRDPGVVASVAELTAESGATGTVSVNPKYGQVAPGKDVTLTAKAAKGSVFHRWEISGVDTEGLDLSSATLKIKMTDAGDVFAKAVFVTAEEDAASIALSVDALGGEISPEAIISVTNTCGVALKWSVAADALSKPVVAVTGLPSGLKFTAKDIMKKGSKTEVDIPANTIYGAPTAESKLDAKTGLRKPSVVKFTVTTAGKSKRVYSVDMTVLPLPDWAVGTFNGGGDLGQVSLTVAKTGKLSGKYLSEGLTWTLAADSFDSIDESGDVYRATLIGKSGKLVITNEIGVAGNAIGGYAESVDYIAYQNNWKLEPWKTVGKPFAKAAALEYEDSASVAGVEAPGVLSLKFAASGAVTVKGSFVTGINEKTGKEILYSASGTAVLAPQIEPDEIGAFDAVVFVYLPPKAGKFDGYVRCIGVRWTGEGWIKQ